VAGFTAFYDANVLYPGELRNLLMHLALIRRFRAKWSADVHEQWISNLLKSGLTSHATSWTGSAVDKARLKLRKS